MNKFFDTLQRKLMPIAQVFSTQKHLLAVRDGVVTAVPFTIVGSIFLIIANPPVNANLKTGIGFIDAFLQGWLRWSQTNADLLNTPYNSTMAIMSLFIAIVVSYSLAKAYGKKAINYAVSSLGVYLMVVAPIKDGMMDVEAFGNKGILLAILIGLGSVELMKFFEEKVFSIKLPSSVPPMVANAFSTLFPFMFTLVVFLVLSFTSIILTGNTIPVLFFTAFDFAKGGVNNSIIITLLTGLESLLYSFGVHPSTVVAGPLLDPLGLINLTENSQAYLDGVQATQIYATPFKSFISGLGGTGATLGLAILMMKGKSKQVRSMGKLAIIPSLFNINEPLVFGLPIFLNPIMIIPFVLTPMVNVISGWLAMSTGLINTAVLNAPWTAPAPIGIWISTLDWKAMVFVVLLIVVDMLIYYPFLKIYDSQKVKEENQTVVEESQTAE